MISIQEPFLFYNPHKSLIEGKNLSISVLGHKQERSSLINAVGGDSRYLFVLFYDSVYAEIKESSKMLPPNSIILWEPSAPRRYGLEKGRFLHSWIRIGGKFLEQMLQNGYLPINIPFVLKNTGIFEHYLLSLHHELYTYSKPEVQILENHLQNMLLELGREAGGTAGATIPEGLLKARNYIDANYKSHITVDKLSEIALYSKYYFSHLFKHYFKRTPVEYIIRLRLEAARELITESDLAIGEIAQSVGYKDIYYFSRHFKKSTGVSPLAFRERTRFVRN